MLKKFFVSMLGTIAGIWISFGLMFVLLIMVGICAGISQSGKKVKVESNSILYLNLSGEVTERQGTPQILSELRGSEDGRLALNQVVGSILTAANDDNIEGIYIKSDGSMAGPATRLEIRQALQRFRESGKWVIAYADSYTQGDYYVSSVADSLYVNPVGCVDIHGLAITTFLYKGLLDKLGVEMQIVKVGTYKSAVEPFVRTEISEENAHQQEMYMLPVWKNIREGIAESRGVSEADVNHWADSIIATVNPELYAGMNVVTRLAYRHEVESILKDLAGLDEDEKLRLVTPSEYAESETLVYQDNSGVEIAVLLAEGDIVDSGKKGIVGPRVVKEIEKITKDEDNDALILRVNSGGGSAFASEQIWEALERYKKTGRPFYVSMGDYAASGGYYISCGADRIYAQPVTLTGSIGIFGMIPNIEGLLENKLGVTQSSVVTNPNANFISITKPMNQVERNSLQRTINRGYETFVGRVAQGRGMEPDSVKAIAEGRIWSGVDALNIGLVDEMGNLNDVVRAVAEKLGAEDFHIVEYPKAKSTFLEMLEELDYSSFTDAMAKHTMTPAEYETLVKTRDILNRNRVQARMPEVKME